MSAKLGSTDVSFRLGAVTPAAVYLGAEQVWTAVVARTLYFRGAGGADWSNLDNWFDDAEGTVQASSLPTAADNVVALADIDDNSDNVPTTVANFATGENLLFPERGVWIFLGITVTGMATFNGTAIHYGTITGNATFNDSSVNAGTVTGTATFNDSACNDGGTAGTFVPDPPPSCE